MSPHWLAIAAGDTCGKTKSKGMSEDWLALEVLTIRNAILSTWLHIASTQGKSN
jgi:hypothetical protein